MAEIKGRIEPVTNVGKERLSIVVELDDRSFLFPAGIGVSHLNLSSASGRGVSIEAVASFNTARHDPRLALLSYEDAREFARKIVDAYYQGRTQHALSEAIKIAIVFNPNGFLLQFSGDRENADLFVTSGAIMRLAQGLLRVLDDIAPVATN